MGVSFSAASEWAKKKNLQKEKNYKKLNAKMYVEWINWLTFGSVLSCDENAV